MYRVFGGTSTYHLTDPLLLLYFNGFLGICIVVTYLLQGGVEHEERTFVRDKNS